MDFDFRFTSRGRRDLCGEWKGHGVGVAEGRRRSGGFQVGCRCRWRQLALACVNHLLRKVIRRAGMQDYVRVGCNYESACLCV